MLDGNVGGEVFAETVGDGADVDVQFARHSGLFSFRGLLRIIEKCLRQLLGSTDGQGAADDLIRNEQMAVRVFTERIALA